MKGVCVHVVHCLYTTRIATAQLSVQAENHLKTMCILILAVIPQNSRSMRTKSLRPQFLIKLEALFPWGGGNNQLCGGSLDPTKFEIMVIVENFTASLKQK